MRRRTFDVSQRDYSTVTRVLCPRTYTNDTNDTVEWLSLSKMSRTTKRRENRRFRTTVFSTRTSARPSEKHVSTRSVWISSRPLTVDEQWSSVQTTLVIRFYAKGTGRYHDELFSNNSVSISSWHTSFDGQRLRYTRVTGAKRLGAMTSQSSLTTANGVKAEGYRVDRTRSIDKRTI